MASSAYEQLLELNKADLLNIFRRLIVGITNSNSLNPKVLCCSNNPTSNFATIRNE